jgi:hypothetical protein
MIYYMSAMSDLQYAKKVFIGVIVPRSIDRHIGYSSYNLNQNVEEEARNVREKALSYRAGALGNLSMMISLIRANMFHSLVYLWGIIDYRKEYLIDFKEIPHSLMVSAMVLAQKPITIQSADDLGPLVDYLLEDAHESKTEGYFIGTFGVLSSPKCAIRTIANRQEDIRFAPNILASVIRKYVACLAHEGSYNSKKYNVYDILDYLDALDHYVEVNETLEVCIKHT